jgi:hypothetical protein
MPSGIRAAAGIDGQAEVTASHTLADQAALEAASVPNDAAIVVATDGRDPKVTGLHTGDTLIAWIGGDDHLHAKLYPPNGVVVPSDQDLNDLTATEYALVNTALADLGPVAANAAIQIAELGPGNFAILWTLRDATNQLGFGGVLFALPPDTAVGGELPERLGAIQHSSDLPQRLQRRVRADRPRRGQQQFGDHLHCHGRRRHPDLSGQPGQLQYF